MRREGSQINGICLNVVLSASGGGHFIVEGNPQSGSRVEGDLTVQMRDSATQS